MINSSALSYWKHTGYSQKDLDALGERLDDRLAAKFIFRPDRGINVVLSHRIGDTKQGHSPAIATFLQKVASTSPKPLIGSILVWLHDGYMLNCGDYHRHAPILTFGRDINDYYSFLIPDPAFLGDQGYKKELANIDLLEKDLTWERKKPTVFWRGASTGAQTEGDRWLAAPRIRLPLLSKELGEPGILDACLSKIVQYPNEELIKRIEDLDILGGYCPFLDFVQYRYQIDLDGYHCAWMSLFKKLFMNSVLLKTDSNFMQWYFDKLKPWVNYIPLSRSLSDLIEKIDWLHAHDEECKKISGEATSLINSIKFEDVLFDTAELLGEIFSCFRNEE